jgi:hypothetical protein
MQFYLFLLFLITPLPPIETFPFFLCFFLILPTTHAVLPFSFISHNSATPQFRNGSFYLTKYSYFQAVILDNTATNTGHSNGLCACLEQKLGRKVHIVRCMLHLNELPLRQLMKPLDGEIISWNKLAGPIRQLLGGNFY